MVVLPPSFPIFNPFKKKKKKVYDEVTGQYIDEEEAERIKNLDEPRVNQTPIPKDFELPGPLSNEDRQKLIDYYKKRGEWKDGSILTPDGKLIGPEEVEKRRGADILATKEFAAEEGKFGIPRAAREERQQQLQQISAQIGQFERLPTEATELDLEEAGRVALIEAIPQAITFGIGTAVVAGRTGALAGPKGAILGAVGGFVGGFARSIISDLKDQRKDMNEKPKIALQDAKSNLNDIISMAATDPANRSFYIARFNEQLAIIDKAHRELKLNTQRDVLLFERSEDVLADFEFFYSPSGERDLLVDEFKLALGVRQDPNYIYRMAELANRRGISWELWVMVALSRK